MCKREEVAPFRYLNMCLIAAQWSLLDKGSVCIKNTRIIISNNFLVVYSMFFILISHESTPQLITTINLL